MTFHIEFAPPSTLMNMNDREHWRVRAQRAKAWRQAAGWACTQLGPHRALPPCEVRVTLPVRDSRKRDPSNYALTTKHLVDGLVDGGLWPDDSPEWVTTYEPTLAPRTHLVHITLIPREAA